MATHTWMWIGNRSLLDNTPGSNITQTQANAIIGWTAQGQDQMSPVDVTANLQGNDIGYRTTYHTQSNPTRVATPFAYAQPPSDANVTGMTVRTFFSATFQVRVPNQDGSGTFTNVTKTGVLMQMSNGDIFIRPNSAEITSWDGIGAISQITVTAVSPLPSTQMSTTYIGPVGFGPAIYQTDVVCFVRGTRIRTADADVAVEDLAVGDMVWTRDHGMQAIRWIGSTVVEAAELTALPRLRPIRIAAGALGAQVPATDLLVSPQHRIVVRSKIAQRMFDTDEILVAAKHLTVLDGIDVVGGDSAVEYFHFLLDQHSVVLANGAETESLFVGPQALEAVGPDARQEITTLFPEILDPGFQAQATIPLTPGRRARQLASRHAHNGQPLI